MFTFNFKEASNNIKQKTIAKKPTKNPICHQNCEEIIIHDGRGGGHLEGTGETLLCGVEIFVRTSELYSTSISLRSRVCFRRES